MTAAAPPPPPAAATVFGDALPAASAYADLLAGPGVERGLLGPREVERLWERHLLNCAVVAPLLPTSGMVLDLGSGAGLPGIVLALLRPDLEVVLVDATRRRVEFLDECVEALGLSRVTTDWTRAEQLRGKVSADVVTARAVAPLDRLLGWAVPLLGRHGELLALKGERAAAELGEAQPLLRRLALRGEIVTCGQEHGDPTTVVRVRREKR